MAKYDCALIYYATEYVEVEADNEKEAEEKAYAMAEACLCHYCSRHLDLEDIDRCMVTLRKEPGDDDS